MTNISAKQWLWTLLIVVPITFYLVEFFIDDKPFGVIALLNCLVSSVLGVLLAYLLFSKVLVHLQHVTGYRFLALFIIMLLVIALSLLINFTGFNHLGILMSKVLVLSFSSSALVLALGYKVDAAH